MVERYIKDRGTPAAKWVFFIIFAALFALDTWLVCTGRTLKLDEGILGAFFDMREGALTTAARAITFCGNTKTVGALCILLLILPGRMKIGLPIGLMTGAGYLANKILKELAARPRPDAANWLVEEDGFSFPSGHANASMIFFVALLILVGRALILQDNRFAAGLLRILLAILAVLIGLSRLYLGVHYPSDVFGGWMLAGLLLIVFFAIYENLWPSKWRVTYDVPEWDAIPRGAEKKRGWKRPSKKRATGELIEFPKKRGAWKIRKPEAADGQKERPPYPAFSAPPPAPPRVTEPAPKRTGGAGQAPDATDAPERKAPDGDGPRTPLI
ncbi:MAG: phosphatase PAP2 family protein [Clostridiales Family XIII bacterium]|jgi:undecaprenyl-diphosphatase|nr:phosphatase PAP2 family protein [Clostridiales Family XIII bacterium]